MKQRILIVDDHPFTRAGVMSILESKESFEIIGEATDGQDAINKVEELHPDIVIMDVSMPQLSGIDATREILKSQPKTKIIALSIHSGENFVKEMLKAGASGYLLKDEAPEELIRAIEKVQNGDIYLSSAVTRAALKNEKTADSLSNKVLKTKIMRPPVYQYLLRTRIIDELERNIAKPLSLTSAGAGYGKSVAISQWLESTERLYAWISLDEEHNDLRIFLAYLVASINQTVPGSMANVVNAISGIDLPPIKDLIYILLSDLCEIEDEMILVLDDYQKINEEKVHQILNEWLHFPPPNIHLSLVTRRDPPLNINTLKLAGRMTEIRMDKLSFTEEEILTLFRDNLNINVSENAVKLLQDKTEGWIIAITLASMVIQNSESSEEMVTKIEGNLGAISDYLVSEVLSRQPENFQDPLLISSILNRFCPEVLDEIFDKREGISGRQIIEYLQKANLFVINLDDEKKWFRYHHLFQDLLQNQISKKFNKEEIETCRRRASKWFEKQGLLEEAMDYALLAKDNAIAAKIIKKHRLDLLSVADYYRLERLQNRIPREYIEADPELLLVDLQIQWHHDNFIRIGQLLEKVQLVIDQLEDDSYVHGELSFFTGFVSLFLKGDLKTALACFDVAHTKIPESSSGPRGVLEVIQPIFSQMGGLYEKVKQMYYELIDKELPPIRKYRIQEGFIVASIDQLNTYEVEVNYLNAISHTRNFQMKEPLGAMLTISAMYLVRKGLLTTAIEYWEEAKELTYSMHSRIACDNMAGLVIGYSLMNEENKSEEILKIMDSYTSGLGDYYNVFLWSTTIRHHMINQDRDKVRNLLPDYNPHVLDLVVYLDIPEITHARALIFEGSEDNMERARDELAHLEEVATAINNRVHLYEVKVLQAVLYDVKGEIENAEGALLASLEIAEPEGITMFYFELGESFATLIKHMPNEIRSRPFVLEIVEEIKQKPHKKIIEARTQEKEKLNILTARELDVLKCISEGLRNQEIAEKLFVSEDTIKKHIYHMFQKMNVKNRFSLVTRAREQEILD